MKNILLALVFLFVGNYASAQVTGTFTVAGTPTCPTGQYAEIAGGLAGMSANVAPGIVYSTDVGATCTAATQQTTVSMATANLAVLQIQSLQVVPVTKADGTISDIIIGNLAAPKPINVIVSNVAPNTALTALVINGTLAKCAPITGALPGTFNCQYVYGTQAPVSARKPAASKLQTGKSK